LAESIEVGVLYDMTPGPIDELSRGGGLVGRIGEAVDALVASGRLDRPVNLIEEYALGLPPGTAHAVERAYGELVERGVLCIVGPAIGDNALVATPLADAARVPTIQWAGTDRARSEYMFQLQVGSHEDEGVVLARHLAALGARRVGVVFDRSPIGRRYTSFFDAECDVLGLELVSRAAISPLASDMTDVIAAAQASGAEAFVYLGLGLVAAEVAAACSASGWDVPVAMNTAGMRGYDPTFARAIDGWVYVDMLSDDNRVLQSLRERLGSHGTGLLPAVGHDLGQLVAEGLARAPELTRDGVKEGLELVKLLPAAEGRDGTTLGFGNWDRGALHGEYLVLRQWRDGASNEI
jgi:branched-chain amino acid transport system substrate-binding protein